MALCCDVWPVLWIRNCGVWPVWTGLMIIVLLYDPVACNPALVNQVRKNNLGFFSALLPVTPRDIFRFGVFVIITGSNEFL